MSLVQKQAGASKGRKFGAHTASKSKRPSLAGIDMMQLFSKAGELDVKSVQSIGRWIGMLWASENTVYEIHPLGTCPLGFSK